MILLATKVLMDELFSPKISLAHDHSGHQSVCSHYSCVNVGACVNTQQFNMISEYIF